jgi:hypothetical protein
MSESEIGKILKDASVINSLRFWGSSIGFTVMICGLYFGLKSDINTVHSDMKTDLTAVKTELTTLISRNYYELNKKQDSVQFLNTIQFTNVWNALPESKRKIEDRGGCIMEKMVNGKRQFISVPCN